MDSGDRRGGYPQKRRAQGTFGRAMAALCALVRMYQTTTTTATRASIHDPPAPPRRNLHLHCAFSAPPARYPSSPLFSLHVHRRPPQKQSSLHIKTQPQPQPRIFVSSSAHLHCRFSFHPSSISQHITPNSHFYFQPPAYITNTHTPLVSP